jgi:hypothetical protein
MLHYYSITVMTQCCIITALPNLHFRKYGPLYPKMTVTLCTAQSKAEDEDNMIPTKANKGRNNR